MNNTVKCDLCGKEMVPADVHSGNGIEDLCFECYHDAYGMDDEYDEDGEE